MQPEQRKLIVAQAVLSNIALLTVLIRTYVRAVHLKSFKMDDWLMAIAQLFNTLALVFLVESCSWGWGRPSEDIYWMWWKYLLHWNFVYSLFMAMSLNIAKISIAFHLLRFFDARNYRKFLYGVICTYTGAVLHRRRNQQ